jgi:hypothetical protein
VHVLIVGVRLLLIVRVADLPQDPLVVMEEPESLSAILGSCSLSARWWGAGEVYGADGALDLVAREPAKILGGGRGTHLGWLFLDLGGE